MTRGVTGRGSGRRSVAEMEVVHAAIRAGISRGYSDAETARYADCNERTVLRYRQRHGIPAAQARRAR